MIPIKEKIIIGKTGNMDTCEDIIAVNENFIAVIDGVTSKFSIKYNGMTSGRYCAEALSKALLELDSKVDAKNALNVLNEAVKRAYNGSDITLENKMQGCIIIYSRARKEIWSYGDCKLMINGKELDARRQSTFRNGLHT